MNNQRVVVVTSIYQPFWGTTNFLNSCKKVGLPVINAFRGSRFTGNGDVIRMLGEVYANLAHTGQYTHIIYADGADSLFVKKPVVPDYILYSTEKAVWPPAPDMQRKWKEHSDANPVPTPWKYINGGGYCGPAKLLDEFFRYGGLWNLKGDVNGQREQAESYFGAFASGVPIKLDTSCEIFQTTGFEDPGDFEYGPGKEFKNLKTGTYPAVLHGNGRTDMTHLYKLYL